VKVGSFNMHAIRARLKIVFEWLQAGSPDVLENRRHTAGMVEEATPADL
jgi:exonuclease III